MKKLLAFTLPFLMAISNPIEAQNLIPNAGFEYNSQCPSGSNHNVSIAMGWSNATSATPEYYHVCGTGSYQIPKTKYKNLSPFDGSAYIGLYFSPSNMEYIQTRLKQPLESGVEYKVSLYVIASDTFNYLTSDIGFYFSKERLHSERKSPLRNIKPQVISEKNKIFSPNKWTEVSGIFIAKGGENFVTIGSFRKSPKKQLINEQNYGNKASYVYIDNVSTVAIQNHLFKNTEEGEIINLDYVYFRINEAELLNASHHELNKLLKILESKKTIKIEIIGHTDNIGTEEGNLKLSKKRAYAVAKYLIQSGIPRDRILYRGEGSQSPKRNNNSVKDRQLNRRVEIRVIE
tara:strand:- start:5364 stop:6401 length:1038 start_codon:yes stop_codon:yes gene_type:complete